MALERHLLPELLVICQCAAVLPALGKQGCHFLGAVLDIGLPKQSSSFLTRMRSPGMLTSCTACGSTNQGAVAVSVLNNIEYNELAFIMRVSQEVLTLEAQRIK